MKKVMRILAILFMAMTAAMNVFGGIGTSCAAFFTKNYPPYWVLIKQNVTWLWQSFVVLTLAVGIAGIFALVALIRGGKHAYRNALIVLIIGAVITGVHFVCSQIIIGKAIPANVVFFTNVITLIIFLLLLIPSLKVDFSRRAKSADKNTGAGVASFVAGMVILTIPMWVGNSHIYMGTSWVDIIAVPLQVFGGILFFAGLGLLAHSVWKSQEVRLPGPETETK